MGKGAKIKMEEMAATIMEMMWIWTLMREWMGIESEVVCSECITS
jgi:hypothetical protein